MSWIFRRDRAAPPLPCSSPTPGELWMRKREGGTNTADAPARHAAALFLLFALPMQEMRARYRRGIIDVPRDSAPCLFPPLLLASYYLLATPRTTPKASESRVLPLPADPGSASLLSESRAREVYPEDWIEGGAYLQLPLGRLRYWLVGPSDRKKIVLIHRLTIPAIAFTRLAPLLAAAGFRVWLYDLRLLRCAPRCL
ncbi:hypothetical protein C8J57DRAFT_1644485 [Mycena rebaudengoi]|nr:hypothetical protein C8J57DRAFT_1644485 [Mycena rebaudengoi]